MLHVALYTEQKQHSHMIQRAQIHCKIALRAISGNLHAHHSCIEKQE